MHQVIEKLRRSTEPRDYVTAFNTAVTGIYEVTVHKENARQLYRDTYEKAYAEFMAQGADDLVPGFSSTFAKGAARDAIMPIIVQEQKEPDLELAKDIYILLTLLHYKIWKDTNPDKAVTIETAIQAAPLLFALYGSSLLAENTEASQIARESEEELRTAQQNGTINNLLAMLEPIH